MGEIKIFVEPNESIINKVIVCQTNADKIGVQNGDTIEVYNSENNLKRNAIIEVSEKVLEFTGEFSKNILNDLGFTGIELILRPAKSPTILKPTMTVQDINKPVLTPLPQTPHQVVPSRASQPTPLPQPPLRPISQSTQGQVFQPTPLPQPPLRPISQSKQGQVYQPTPLPQPPLRQIPQPIQGQIPRLTPPPKLSSEQAPQLVPGMPTAEMSVAEVQIELYPNKVDINVLLRQKSGIALTPVASPIEGGRIQLSSINLQRLGLGQGMLIGWEDPLTRSIGSARIDQATISDAEIRMSKDTIEDTNIKAGQIVVYSTEPPIQKVSEIFLEVQSQPNLNGYCQVSPRTQYTLSLQNNDILAFEDELTGAVGAGKVQIMENAPDASIIIDSEILEASGIGSLEVKVTKNQRQIIPLQSIYLGVSPISGEKMWEIISAARQNINGLKDWLSNYIIFKGIKLRWAPLNIACSILNCVPDLTGDILAQVSPNTTLALSPTGLVPFNAILILDISRSMMARDVQVKNIAPAIEGIKAAMESREIQEFLKNFKEGINIPRRVSAAFAAVLFLSEKVGRGFGEKVSVIRFADEAQLLPFGNTFYMDSASGKKGVLEEAARMIVDRIGNSYGQATNMGAAMVKAHEVLLEFQGISPDQPTMIMILTDGIPTDPQNFLEAVKLFSENPNVVIYIVGLGNPDDEMMNRAAQLCGGEYFKPQDAGELLIWYSKRARDLTVKLKAHKK